MKLILSGIRPVLPGPQRQEKTIKDHSAKVLLIGSYFEIPKGIGDELFQYRKIIHKKSSYQHIGDSCF